MLNSIIDSPQFLAINYLRKNDPVTINIILQAHELQHGTLVNFAQNLTINQSPSGTNLMLTVGYSN